MKSKSDAMARTLISAAVDKGLNDIARDPKRSIRQLVDLGTFFAKGRFQRYFFDIFGEILHNDNSPYYDLVAGMVADVDRKLLKTFGMNLIYNGWTVGAKTVRKVEAETGCNVPWTLLLALEDTSDKTLADVQAVIDASHAAGIFSYMFFFARDCDPTALSGILQHNRTCAFLLFLEPAAVSPELCALVLEAKNAFLLVNMRAPGFTEKAAMLREAHCLFGASYPYHAADTETIHSGTLAAQATAVKAPFLFFVAQPDCPMPVQKDICAYTMQTRQAPTDPILYIDLYSDLTYIGDVISSEPSCVRITDSNRKPLTPDDFRPFPEQWPFRQESPEQIMAFLQQQAAKTKNG